jgi:hypothetical protein
MCGYATLKLHNRDAVGAQNLYDKVAETQYPIPNTLYQIPAMRL